MLCAPTVVLYVPHSFYVNGGGIINVNPMELVNAEYK